MSSERGNASRTRPQKHKNRSVFKNNMHDTSHTTKFINSIQVSNVCGRCRDIIEWKIKYKKYKPLTQPAKCVRCEQRNVRKAYHTMCSDCGKKYKVCTKCCQSKEIVLSLPDTREQLQLDVEMKQLLQSLPERKRRTFLRYMSKKNSEDVTVDDTTADERKQDLVDKLSKLKRDESDEEFDYDSENNGGSDSSSREDEN